MGDAYRPKPKLELWVSNTIDGNYTNTDKYLIISIGNYNEIDCYIVDPSTFYKVKNIGINGEVSNPIQIKAGETKFIDFQKCDAKMRFKDYSEDLYFIFDNEVEKSMGAEALDRLAEQIKKLKRQSKNVHPLIVDFTNTSNAGPLARGEQYRCCLGEGKIVENAYVILYAKWYLNSLIKNGNTSQIFSTIAHEYGHTVNTAFPKTTEKFGRIYSQLSRTVGTQQGVWNDIMDGHVGYEPFVLSGHPQDNANEMFASFFNAYFTNHERLYGIIMYHERDGSDEQNILKYMWQYFVENVGKVYDDDDQYFKPLGGKLGTTNYSFDQIRSGQWLEENYRSLSLIDKAELQYQRHIAPVFQTMKFSNVVDAVNKVADWLLNELTRLNMIGDAGIVKGKIIDENGSPVSYSIIQIGPAIGVTNSAGDFTIRNIPSGSIMIEQIVTKDKNDQAHQRKIKNPNPRILQIKKGTSIKPTIVVQTINGL